MIQSSLINHGFEGYLLDILKSIKPNNILVVTGEKSFDDSNIASRLMPLLSEYKVQRYSGFSSNITVEDLNKGIEITRQFMPDIIIAIGGGSVIDMAKQINIFSKHDNIPNIIINNQKKLGDKLCPLVAIPTTTGTGSEETHFAVIYIDKKKYSVANKEMIPEHKIIDSSLSHSMPIKLQASCGFDALSQSVESYWSIKSSEESRRYSMESIKLIIDNFKRSIDGDLDSKNNMAKAANLSGKAINISKTTAAHAISYPLTIHYDIPHGHAVALTLGYFFEINSKFTNEQINEHRGGSYLKNIMKDLFRLFNVNNARECKQYWYKLMKDVGLEINANKLGITDEKDIQRILHDVDPVRISNHPIMISKEIIHNILSSMITKND